MLTVLLEHLDSLSLDVQMENLWVARELGIGAGRSDIILCNRFIDKAFSEISPEQARIVAYLRSIVSAKIGTIEKRMSTPQEKIYPHLNDLCKKGIVRSSSNGAYSISKTYWTGLRKAIAIEGKISDWKGALRQAVRNQLFAKQSYIALPMKRAIKVSERTEILCTTVGVIGIDAKTGDCMIVKPAEEKYPIAWFYHYLLMKENIATNRSIN